MTERADAIHEIALRRLDRQALEGVLDPPLEAIRILVHNVRDVPDRAWARAMEAVGEAVLTPEEVAALPGSPPEPVGL